jgi:hypothetical protein
VTIEYVGCGFCYNRYHSMKDLHEVLMHSPKVYSYYDAAGVQTKTERFMVCTACLDRLKEELNERKTDS